MDIKQKIGEHLKELRTQKNLSQKAVAYHANIPSGCWHLRQQPIKPQMNPIIYLLILNTIQP